MLKKSVLALLIVGLVAGCSEGNNNDSGSSSNTGASGAISTAETKVSNAVPDTGSVSASTIDPLSLNSEWTDTDYAIGGDFGSNPRNAIRIHGDSDAQSSLMYRFNQALENLCNFTSALPTSGGDLTLTSESTVTLTAAVKSSIESDCGSDLSSVPDDTVIRYAVEDISGNSGANYERKVSFDLGNTSTYTDFFYYTNSGNTTRFLYTEDGTNDSAAFFDYDASSNVARFEFSEAAGSFDLHYRVLLLEDSNAGFFTAWIDNGTDSSRAVVATFEGGGDEIAVSYSFTDDGANDITEGNACISTSDFSVANDNTLTCTGVTGSSVTGYTSDHSDINSSYITGLDETASINFNTSSNILTAAEGGN
jgi:hypothetical protein